MSNGHPGQNNTTVTQPLFTEGSGKPINQEKNFQQQDDLNFPNLSTETIQDPERNPREIANIAMRSKEDYQSAKSLQSEASLGEITEVVDITMPPGMELLNGSHEEECDDASIQPNIRANNSIEHRNGDSVITETQKDVSEYEKNKISPAEIIDLIHKDSDNYIKTEFGRVLGK